jgi:ATP-dependent Clp protease adaptor protein ClpS
MQKEKGAPDLQNETDLIQESGLILFNDEINSFDFVIECLIDICRHGYEQAEQCAVIAHYNGRCHIKSGDIHTLKPMYDALTIKGLTVSIE